MQFLLFLHSLKGDFVMKMKWIALAVAAAIPAAAMAIGGASGPKIDYEVQGHIGEVMGNPYGIAPLTAGSKGSFSDLVAKLIRKIII